MAAWGGQAEPPQEPPQGPSDPRPGAAAAVGGAPAPQSGRPVVDHNGFDGGTKAGSWRSGRR